MESQFAMPTNSNQPELATSHVRRRRRSEFNWPLALSIAGAFVCLNTVLIHNAARDQSWGALGIAFGVAPMANGVLGAVFAGGLLAAMAYGARTAAYVWLSLALAVGSIGIDMVLILLMHLHGS
jgi:hypothetical protein